MLDSNKLFVCLRSHGEVILDSGIYSRIVAMLAEHTRRFGVALRLRNHCLPQCSRYRLAALSVSISMPRQREDDAYIPCELVSYMVTR